MITIIIYFIAGIVSLLIAYKLYLSNRKNPSEITSTVLHSFMGISTAFILYAVVGITVDRIPETASDLLVYISVVALYTGFYFVAITPLALGYFKKEKSTVRGVLFIWLILIYVIELIYIPEPHFTEEGLMLMQSAPPVKIVVVSFLILAGLLNVVAWSKKALASTSKIARTRSWAFAVASATGPEGIALMVVGSAFARAGFVCLVICSLAFAVVKFARFNQDTDQATE